MEIQGECLTEEGRSFLEEETGYKYVFASASSRIWSKDGKLEEMTSEPFYQIMPDTFDDGFWDWYCLERAYYQFFKTREACIIHFLNHRRLWLKSREYNIY